MIPKMPPAISPRRIHSNVSRGPPPGGGGLSDRMRCTSESYPDRFRQFTSVRVTLISMTREEALARVNELSTRSRNADFFWAARRRDDGDWEVVKIRRPRAAKAGPYKPGVVAPPQPPHPGPPREPSPWWGGG